MIDFNEIKITPDGQKLIIDISINDLPYFNDRYIESVFIDNQNSYVEFGPSFTPIYSWEDENPLIVNGQIVRKKHLRLELSETDLQACSLSANMFYVYVRVGGDLAEDTPCELSQNQFIRVVFDYGFIYRAIMTNIKQIEKNCEIPRDLINDILKINAIELSLISGHYVLANKYWNKFYKLQANKLKKNKKCC